MLTGINHVTIAVKYLDRSIFFYHQILGFKLHVKWDKGAYLTVGDQWICLSVDEVKVNQDYSHLAFSIPVGEYDDYAEKLLNHNVRIWKENKSEGLSFYFLDPDGFKLEIHVGDLISRLSRMKLERDNNYTFYNE